MLLNSFYPIIDKLIEAVIVEIAERDTKVQ